MSCPATAACNTEFGLSTICCVMLASPAPFVRNSVGFVRSCSGKWILPARLPIGNGRMSVSLILGGPFASSNTLPCARMVVPCGIEAMRTTVGGSRGLAVLGTVAQMPGSMCSPSPVLPSLICCKYVTPNILMSGCSNPRFGIGPLISWNCSVSSVRLSSRNLSWPRVLDGRQIMLKPTPRHSPGNRSRGKVAVACRQAEGERRRDRRRLTESEIFLEIHVVPPRFEAMISKKCAAALLARCDEADEDD